MHAGGLEGPWVHGFERVAVAAARKEPKHSAEYILSTGVVFSQYLTILSHVCRLNTLLCRRIGRGAEGTSCCEVFSAQCGSQRVFLLWCTLAGLGRSSPRAGRSCFGRRDSEGERQQKQKQRTLRCRLEQHAQ